MAKTWDERLAELSVKLGELSKKASDASEDAKVYRELRKEAIQDKISTVKGDVAAMQENARLAEEEQKGKIKSALLKARMTVQAKHEDRKDARDAAHQAALIAVPGTQGDNDYQDNVNNSFHMYRSSFSKQE